MDTYRAQLLTVVEIEKHQLVGWQFKWIRAKHILGQCNWRKKEIRLSKPFVERNPEHVVMDTILHEIAHALAGPQAGHGPEWKLTAIRLGARPLACKDPGQFPDFVPTPGKFKASCQLCGQTYNRERAVPLYKTYRCGKCYRFDRRRSQLTFVLNEQQ